MTDVERCPSCKRLHRVLRYGWGYRFVPHLDDGVFCKGSRAEIERKPLEVPA